MGRFLSRSRKLLGLTLAGLCLSVVSLGQEPRGGERSEEIPRLLKTLDDPQLRSGNPDRLAGAIRRAGELRTQESVDSLVRLLTFRYKSPREREAEDEGIFISVQQPYPAVSALFQIGEPALPALIRRISSDEGEEPGLARKNAAQAVMLVFREDPRKGICYFKAAAAKASSPLAMHWLEEAAESGRKWLPPDSPPPACP
jgi:HEAT repeat protein